MAARRLPGRLGAARADVREEAVLLAGLCVCMLGVALQPAAPAAALAATAEPAGRGAWLLALALQALPYVAVLACAGQARFTDAGRAEGATGGFEASHLSAAGD